MPATKIRNATARNEVRRSQSFKWFPKLKFIIHFDLRSQNCEYLLSDLITKIKLILKNPPKTFLLSRHKELVFVQKTTTQSSFFQTINRDTY